jgi:dolichyl-phosphate beta-glucosyltransferase
VDVFHRAKIAHGHLGVTFKILHLRHRGKGAAVRAGIQAAAGDPIAFLDADLTIPVEIIELFIGALDTGADIAVASRYVPGSIVDRPWWRRVMGDAYRAVVQLLVPTGVRDTQCGGKMYTAEAATDLFSRQRLDGFAFDAEVLFLARRARYRVREIPFALRQHGETSVSFLADTPRMFRDLFLIRLNALLGVYGR